MRLDLLIRQLGPVIATGKQDGYILRIHDKHALLPNSPSPARITDKNKNRNERGTMTIQSPDGEIVKGKKWMDWAEEHYPVHYTKLPLQERALLEVEEQKKYGYKKEFEFYKKRNRINRL